MIMGIKAECIKQILKSEDPLFHCRLILNAAEATA